MGILVEGDAARGDGVALGLHLPAASAQEGADAGDQLAQSEGLCQVIFAADFQADDLVQLGIASAQEQHRRIGLRPQPAAELVAIHSGKHDVEHEEVVVVFGCKAQRIFAVRGDIDLEAFLFQGVSDEIGDGLLVVDGQDTCGTLVHLKPPCDFGAKRCMRAVLFYA